MRARALSTSVVNEVVSILGGLDFDTDGLLAGEGTLGLLDFALQFTESAEIATDVSASLHLVLLDEVVDDPVIDIFTTKVNIASSRQDLEDTIVDGKEGHIEGASSEFVDNGLGFAIFLVKTVGDGGSGRLVDDKKDAEAGDGTGILGSLTLSIVKVFEKVSDDVN